MISDPWLRNRARNHNYDIQAAQCLLNHQDAALTQIWDEKYGPINPQALKIAQEFAQDLIDGNGKFRNNKPILSDEIIDVLDECHFDVNQIEYWFEEALSAYGFCDWVVIIDERASAIDVRRYSQVLHGEKVIIIPANRKPVSGRKLIKLIAHEIGCHVHDHECSEIVLGSNLAQPLDDLVSEGHAMYVENQIELALFGSCPKYPLPWYTLALNYHQLGMPIPKIAQTIYEKRLAVLGGAGHEEKALRLTWTTLYRTLFRGRTQASSRYCYPKDKSYLEGYLLAENLCNAGKEYLLAFSALDQNELVNAADSLTSTSASGLTLIDKHKNILCDLSTRIFDDNCK